MLATRFANKYPAQVSYNTTNNWWAAKPQKWKPYTFFTCHGKRTAWVLQHAPCLRHRQQTGAIANLSIANPSATGATIKQSGMVVNKTQQYIDYTSIGFTTNTNLLIKRPYLSLKNFLTRNLTNYFQETFKGYKWLL